VKGLTIMRTLLLVIHAAWILAVMPAASAPDAGLEKFNGKQVSFSFIHSVNGINPVYGPFAGGEARWQGVIQISGRSVSGSITRTATYRGQLIGTLSNSLAGEIEQPQEGTRGGHYVWVLRGNSLVLVQNYLTGSAKITITFSGNGCSIRAQLVRDVGAGYAGVPSVSGGVSAITRSRQVSSTCTVDG
jgi:hypothetical protein